MTDTTSELWLRAKDILVDLLGLPSEERDAALQAACGGDARLRAEVGSLLAAEGKERDFLGSLERALDEQLHRSGRAEDMLGVVLDGFELEAVLGRGGMGTVYRAKSRNGGDDVAVKVLHPEILSTLTRRRFDLERMGLARLDHPYIASLIHGGATADGLPFTVMELVDGQPIDRYADELRLSIAERVDLLVRVATAVTHAHERHVIHRDLKPSNILVRPNGEPSLVDFGIAKLLQEGETGDPGTLTGMARAYTLVYSSPEQLDGLAVSAASDVYSLGAVAYQLLAGATPTLDSQNRPVRPRLAMERSRAEPERVAANRSISPDELRRQLDGRLARVLMRACEPVADRRYSSVADFSEALGRSEPHAFALRDWIERLRS